VQPMSLAIAAAMAAGTAAHGVDAVQWRVADGGNGHWYARVESPGTWQEARLAAVARGGDLATVTSKAEHDFVGTLGAAGHWLGGFALPNQGCRPSAWRWVTGEPMTSLGWTAGELGTCSSTCLQVAMRGGSDGRWRNQDCAAVTPGYLLEFDADCDGNGIVDFGQILDGTLIDMDGNGVPDCCDLGVLCFPCPADLNNDRLVNGADLSILLGFWGLTGTSAGADLDGNGIVGGADLGQLLGSWGPCS
jgi:hypothetical protein